MNRFQLLRSIVAATVISLLLMTYAIPMGSVRADNGDDGTPPPSGSTNVSLTAHDTTFDTIAPARDENPPPNPPPPYNVSPYNAYLDGNTTLCSSEAAGFFEPQWRLVNGDNPVTVEGQVTGSKLASDDNFIDHHSRDRNFFIYPDEKYAHLLAKPGQFHTGEDNEHGRIEVEWESAAFPVWALPMQGDRVHVEGSYIWDCAHGADTGYRTEIHPAQFLMTLRDAADHPWCPPSDPPDPNCVNSTATIPARPGWTDTMPGLGSIPIPVTRADIFASSDGGEAREQETCFSAILLPPPPGCPPDWYQDIRGTYDVVVPAPPKPDPDAQLITKIVHHPFLTCSTDNDCGGALDMYGAGANPNPNRFTFTEESGGPTGTQIHIHVDLTGQEPNSLLYGFGFTYEVGWNRPATVVPRRLKVTIEGVHVSNTLDDPCAGCEDGEWELSSLIGDTFKHMLLTGNGVSKNDHQDVPDTDDVKVGDHGVKSSGSDCALVAKSGADPGPCQTQFDVTLLPGQPLRVFFRGEEHDTEFNDEIGLVEHIFTETDYYGIGDHTEWFQERSSAADDALDEACQDTGCGSVTYKIEDDPFPAPPATTLTTGSPTVGQGGNTWVTSASDITLQSTAPSGPQANDALVIHQHFWRSGIAAPADTVCGPGGNGIASCVLHLDANDKNDGMYTLEYWTEDTNTGAIEATQTATFMLDNTAPTTGASLASLVDALVRGWYNKPVTVTLTALDGAGVGVDHTGYTVDGGLVLTYSTPFTVSGDKDSHTILFSSTDKLTNKESLKSTSFKIDTTPPALAISSPSNDPGSSYTQDELLGGIFTNATSLDVTYAASDLLSGVYAVRLDGNPLASFSGKITIPLPLGVSTHTLVAEDVAGNLTTRTFSVVSIPLPVGMIPAPQGAGFWKNAVVNVDYTSAQLSQLLAEADVASRAFGTPTNRYSDATLANYQSYLAVTPNDTVDLKVRRELLTAWLNLVSGRESATQKIDLKSVSAWQSVVTNTSGLSTTTALNLVRESERRLEGNPPPSSILLDTIQTLLNKLNAGKLNLSK